MIAKISKNRIAITRFLIQLVFFITALGTFVVAFNGVKYIFSQIGTSEYIEPTSFVVGMIGLFIYTAIFGRFFCGFACAFGSLGDWIYFISRKIQRKFKIRTQKIQTAVSEKLQYLRFVVLALVILVCFLGSWDKIKGLSPWDVFSLIVSRHFAIKGYVAGMMVLLVIVVGMAMEERFFCKFLCPMGGVFSLIPTIPFFGIHKSKNTCLGGCSACERSCPMSIELEDDSNLETNDRCIQCQKCLNVCPKQNNHVKVAGLRGNEIWWTIIRALILLDVFWMVGII